MGTLLRYPYEVRAEEDYFDDIQDVKVQGHPRCGSAHRPAEDRAIEPGKFEDRYEAALVDLVNSKRHGDLGNVTAHPHPRTNVYDLMMALQRGSRA